MALLAIGGNARADYFYEFTDSSGNAASNATATNPGSFSTTVNQGSIVNIRLYLVQDNAGTSNGLTTVGLNSAGVQLNTSSPGIATVTAVTPNAAFGSSSTTTGASASVSEFINGSTGVIAPTTGPDANRVLLGTFTFTGVSGGSTLTLTALPGMNPDNVLNNGSMGNPGTAIDGFITTFPSASITVVAVPEPGSLLLSGMAVAAFAGGWYRRRRQQLSAS